MTKGVVGIRSITFSGLILRSLEMPLYIHDPKRIDLSPFIIHFFTKDSTDGRTARQNLLAILSSGNIEARSYKFYFRRNWRNPPRRTRLRRNFMLFCLSEIPLTMIRLLVKPEHRGNVHLKPYGLFFLREEMIDQHGLRGKLCNRGSPMLSGIASVDFSPTIRRIRTRRSAHCHSLITLARRTTFVGT